jgi:glutamate-1-semialdehyde 2,1-aminomutase
MNAVVQQSGLSLSEECFRRSSELFPGGVNSPVRAFGAVGGTPFFVERGEGPYLYDLDGNRYVDYIGSWGPLVLGHADPDVIAALSEQMTKGTSYGAPSAVEAELGMLIQEYVPSLDLLRFVNSGTEAGMAVLRLARGFTQRSKIVKFSGCYHGHADSLLVSAGSGVATLGLPNSPGVSVHVAQDTLVVEYNALHELEDVMNRYGPEVAAVIIEPVCGNAGFIEPLPGFLDGVRQLCNEHGSLLIFDEVMTGFRVSPYGAQGLFKVKPDLTMLGKVIGGGLPVGAFGGRGDIMRMLAPLGPVYQAGTLSGNPLAMVAGKVTLQKWLTSGAFAQTELQTKRLVDGIKQAAQASGIPCVGSSLGAMFGFFFTDRKVSSYLDAQESDKHLFSKIFHALLRRGVYIAPSPFEAGFVSSTHTASVIDETLRLFGEVCALQSKAE